MQGLADGYFVIPYTIGDLSRCPERVRAHRGRPGIQGCGRCHSWLTSRCSSQGSQPVSIFHKKLGQIMWTTADGAYGNGLKKALQEIRSCEEFLGQRQCSRLGGYAESVAGKSGRVPISSSSANSYALDALTERELWRPLREEYQHPMVSANVTTKNCARRRVEFKATAKLLCATSSRSITSP